MVKDRTGYHTLGLQIPDKIWRLLEKEAERRGLSATKVLTLVLAAHFGIQPEELPKPKKSGRKPKKK